MKLVPLLSAVMAVAIVASPTQADDYELSLRSNGEELAVIELSITDDTAVTKVADITERFDLKDQRWQHDETKQWVTLAQCENWAKLSKEKTSKSIAEIPEQSRAFVQWSTNPKFEVGVTEDCLTLTSGQIDYKIAVEKSDRDQTDYFRYAKLNAYKKSMTESKLPPFAELFVLQELERRKLMPKSMEVQIPGIPGAPSFNLVITAKGDKIDSKENRFQRVE